jgi:hypothetical protein
MTRDGVILAQKPPLGLQLFEEIGKTMSGHGNIVECGIPRGQPGPDLVGCQTRKTQ